MFGTCHICIQNICLLSYPIPGQVCLCLDQVFMFLYVFVQIDLHVPITSMSVVQTAYWKNVLIAHTLNDSFFNLQLVESQTVELPVRFFLMSA